MPTEGPRGEFPFTWTPERGVPAHLRVRAEGMPLRQAIWHGLGYLRKYRDAKWTAPPEEVRHFGGQRRLLRELGREPAEGARLALVGDLMWLSDGWGSFLSPGLLDHLNAHDAVLGNLETPISKRARVPRLLPDYFTYNSDPRLVTSFRRPGGASTFAALATANNHCLDRGDDGLLETLDFLDGEGIRHSGVRRGADEPAWTAFEAGGVRVGFYAACWGLNDPAKISSSRLQIEVLEGLAPRVRLPVNLDRVRRVMKEMADSGVEFRVVCLHWGHEFELYPTPELMQVGREVVRAGADVVMGSHPHVVQPLEVVEVVDDNGLSRRGLIAYSLGNFATAMFTLHCRVGLVLGLRLARGPDGRVAWRRPEPRLVINVRRDPAAGRRRLLLLEDYLRDCARHGGRARPVRDFAAYLFWEGERAA